MVDISAQLSLTTSALGLAPAAFLGLDTVDSQAFGDLLAGQIATPPAATADGGAPASPLPPLPVPAGNRQPAGKMLPGAAQILPGAATIGIEAPADLLLPVTVAAAPVAAMNAKLAAPLLRPIEKDWSASENTEAADVPQADASPVHGLIKMLTATLARQRPVADSAETGPSDPEAPAAEAEVVPAGSGQPAPAAPIAAPVQFVLPPLPVAAAATKAVEAKNGNAAQAPLPRPLADTVQVQPGQPSAGHAQHAQAGLHAAPQAVLHAAPQAVLHAAPQAVLHAAPQAVLHAAPQAVLHAAPHAALHIAPPAAVAPPAEAEMAPVLTVAGKAEAVAAVVTLAAEPVLIAGKAFTARIKVAAAEPKDAEPLPTDRPAAVQTAFSDRLPAEAALRSDRAAPAVAASLRAPLAEGAAAERIVPALASAPVAPVIADAQPQVANLAAPAVAAAPTVEMPRQDFAALVERLIEARNAGTANSTQATVNHADFGQVSLQFQRDGSDLNVSMSSADPEFAIAAQAAMPAERQNANADTGPRGQSQGQSQSQSAGSSANHESAGQRGAEAGDQQNRNGNGQGRNSRGGTNTSNPSQRWTDGGQPQSRTGVFA